MVRENPLAKGVTFSGGEPFEQADGFAKLAELLKGQRLEIASYTGYCFEELLEGTDAQRRLLEKLDVLIDGEYKEEERSLSISFRGSRNQRIIDVKKSLAEGRAIPVEAGRWNGKYD